MIQAHNHPLPDKETRDLIAWLRMPAAALFRKHLASKAAALTAEAGCLLVNGEEFEKVAAENKAEEARRYVGANKIIDEMMMSGYKFHNVELKPEIKPID